MNKLRASARQKYGLITALVVVLSFVFYSAVFTTHTQAAAGTNQQLNYQGRLLDITGAVVADGLYNMEFKIYQDGNGCVSGGLPPCGGTLKWTETYIQANRVTVKNGYFSVNLASLTAFGGSVDWNQDTLWLSINIGGTTNTPTPTWDGEMTPFKRLTSTPYALNSAQLGGLTAANFLQLAQGVQTDTSITNASIFVNKNNASLTPNILQLQKAGSDVFVVDNGGALSVTPSVTASTIILGSTAQTGTITLGQYNGASTSIINIGNNAGASSTQQVNITSSATGISTLVLGSSSSTSTTTIRGGTGGININPNGSSNTGLIISPTNNSTSALQIQSASAADTLFSADTTNNKLIVGNATGTNANTTQLIVDSSTADPSSGSNGAIYYNSTSNKLRCYQNSAWGDCTSGTANSTATYTSGLANVTASQTGVAVENLMFTTATAVSSIVGTTGLVAPAGGSFRTCLVKNNAIITAGTLSLRWRVNGASVGATACNMNSTTSRNSSTALDPGVVTFSQGDTITIAFDTNAAYAPATLDYTVYWSVEFNSTLTAPAGATLQSAYDNNDTITTTDTHDLLVNAADTATDANVLFNLQCVTSCSTNGRFAVQNAGTDIFTVNPNSGNIVLAPTGTGDGVITLDNDSNLQVNATITGTGPTINPVDITLTHNATVAGTLYGLSITNADNGVNAGVPAALAYLRNANAAETVADGLLVEQTGAGTLTNGIEIRRTAGTVTNGLTFTGAIGSELRLQNSETIANGTNGTILLAADSGALALSLSGTAATVSNTAGALGITAAAGLNIASSANNNIALNPNGTGDVVITQAAGSGAQITASAAPTVDMLDITNAGFGSTTAGVSGLQITYVGGAAAVESSGQRIDLTGGTTAGGTWNGLRVTQGTITAGTTVQDIKLETAALTSTSGATIINGLNLATAGAINSATAGSITWSALNVSTPNVTQGAGGSAAANGLRVTLGTLTTGGTQTGLSILGSSSNTAGTQTAINIAGITPGGATETGIAIGAGYDTGISITTAAAATGLSIVASAAPTTDMVNITNSGFGAATAGVNGLQITYVGGAAAVESSGIDVALTGGTTAGGTWNGIRLAQGTVTSGTTVNDIKLETAATTTTSGTTVINGLILPTAGAISSTTAGSVTWNGLSLTNANVTQGAGGSAAANSIALTLGTIATAGVQNGLKFNNITAPTVGQTAGLSFGSGNSTTWSDLHSATAANNNTANVVITKSAVGANANTFTIKNDASTMVNLFELRDLTGNTNQFGGLALSDAFASRQSYFGEEFTSIRTNCDNATFAAATNNLSRGSQASGGIVSTTACTTTGTDIGNGEISTSSVSGTSAAANVCQYRSGANAPGTNTNGFESVIATSGASTVNVQCLEYVGAATDNTGNMIFNSGNLPQVQVKFRPVQLAQAQRYYLGIGNKVTATNALAATDRGVYFTNCTVPNTPTCGTGLNVVLEDGTAAPTTVGPTNAMACPGTDIDGNASTANVFAYGRLEFRKATSTTSVEIQAFVDYNVTNGIHETSCGTLTTTANAMGNTAMTMVAMTAITATGAGITSQLDLDYFRVWQDDAPAFGDLEVAAKPASSSNLQTTDLSAPAPLAVDVAAGPDPNASATIIDFMAATDQDSVFYGDVYVHGTLYADKIKANQIEGIEVITNQISSLQEKLDKSKVAASGSSPPPVATGKSLNINDLTAVNLVALAQLSVKGGLSVDKEARFNGKTVFQLLAEFNGPAKFNGEVSFNSDAGGTARIKKDAKKVNVKFTKEYSSLPIITANYLFKGADSDADEVSLQRLLDGGYSFTVSQTTTKGFSIVLNKPATEDVNFTWLATLINNPQISQTGEPPSSSQ